MNDDGCYCLPVGCGLYDVTIQTNRNSGALSVYAYEPTQRAPDLKKLTRKKMRLVVSRYIRKIIAEVLGIIL